MYRVWVDLGAPFGIGFLPKELAWEFDELGIPRLDKKPKVVSYWEFNTISEANDWVYAFCAKRTLRNLWVPPRETFEVREVNLS